MKNDKEDMSHLTEEQVLEILKEDSYLSDPKDYKEGMIIDETPKAIRDSILSDDNHHVEGVLEALKRLDEYEDKLYGVTPRQKKAKEDLDNLVKGIKECKEQIDILNEIHKKETEENLIKAMMKVYDPEDYVSKKEHARVLNLDGYVKNMSGIFHTYRRNAFDKYPMIDFMDHYVYCYQRHYSDMRQLLDFYKYKLENGYTQEEIDITKKSIEECFDKYKNDVVTFLNRYYEKMEKKKNG